MRRQLGFVVFVLALTLLGYALWPLMEAHLPLIKKYLIQFRHYCHAHAALSYMFYTMLLCATILVGLPLVTLWMLAAGIFYGFWEAAALVTISRLLAALICFMIARRILNPAPQRRRKSPTMLRLLERHPNIGLFLVRLAPIPDGVVNYTSAAAPITHRDYMLVSLLGMIPITLLCVWMGQELGTISSLIRWIQ